MADYRLMEIILDESSLSVPNPDMEQERRIAVFDLLEENLFQPLKAYPQDYQGPYRLGLAAVDGRLSLIIKSDSGEILETIILAMTRFRHLIRDYFAICDSYFNAVRASSTEQIETIDMARRGVHNEAAELLIERLADKIRLDFPTARRLFTLIAILHHQP